MSWRGSEVDRETHDGNSAHGPAGQGIESRSRWTFSADLRRWDDPWPALDAAVDEEAGTGAAATATLSAAVVDTIAVDEGGENYNEAPTVVISGGGATTQATATATVAAGAVTVVTVDTGGTGYSSVPAVTFVSVDAVWMPVGASPFNSDLFGREGSKISKPQDVMEYYGARTLGKLAAVRTKDDLMIDGRSTTRG